MNITTSVKKYWVKLDEIFIIKVICNAKDKN